MNSYINENHTEKIDNKNGCHYIFDSSACSYFLFKYHNEFLTSEVSAQYASGGTITTVSGAAEPSG